MDIRIPEQYRRVVDYKVREIGEKVKDLMIIVSEFGCDEVVVFSGRYEIYVRKDPSGGVDI